MQNTRTCCFEQGCAKKSDLKIKIWNCQEFLIPDTTLIQKYANGEIVGKFSDNSFLINFVDGLLLVTEHEFPLEVEHSKIILKGDKDV